MMDHTAYGVFSCRMRFRPILTALLLLVTYPPLLCAADTDAGFWSLQLENDLWGSQDDRFYTHGTEISFASAEPAPAYLENITDMLPFYHKGEEGLHGFSIGQKVFTPDNITQTESNPYDRPYAGWLYLDWGIAHQFEQQGDEERINGLVLTIGVVGPNSYADSMQKFLHNLTNSEYPQGWDHQLHNELGLGASYTRKWRKIYHGESGREFELSRHGGVTLGNVYTYASIGAMVRWGTQLKNDIGPPSISPGFTGIPAFRPDTPPNWYLFGGTEIRAVARNIFLDGNTFKESQSVEKRNLVADLQFGVAFHYDNMRFALSNMVRSREYEGQVDRSQYGAINFTFYTN